MGPAHVRAHSLFFEARWPEQSARFSERHKRQRSLYWQMSTENSSDPIPCAAGCGFFGREATNNMCSKCFREHQERAKAAQAATTTPPPPSSTSVASPAVTKPSVTSNPVLAPAVPANMMTCTPCPEPQPAPAVGDSPLAPTPSSDAAVAPHPQSAAVGLISAPETLAPMLTPSHSASLAPADVAAAYQSELVISVKTH